MVNRAIIRTRRLLGAIGRPIVDLAGWILAAAGMAVAVVVEAARPIAWRAPVKAQFMQAMVQAGVGGVRPAMVSGVLFGIVMVLQAAYWLRAAGQVDLVGKILVLLLIREIAPVMVGLILVGRSASAMMIELSLLRSGGQLRALAAQGIEPFRFLVMPRVVALALSQFALTIVFVATALLLGHLFGTTLGMTQRTLFGFLDAVLGAMTPSDFVLVPLKSLTIGLAIGIVSALAVFNGDEDRVRMQELVARGFVAAVLTVFVVSGLLSVLL
jgi:ABC-type transport system involved in resistance to organic solvents, permease component